MYFMSLLARYFFFFIFMLDQLQQLNDQSATVVSIWSLDTLFTRTITFIFYFNKSIK